MLPKLVLLKVAVEMGGIEPPCKDFEAEHFYERRFAEAKRSDSLSRLQTRIIA